MSPKDPVTEIRERAREFFGRDYARFMEMGVAFALSELRRLGASALDVEGMAREIHDACAKDALNYEPGCPAKEVFVAIIRKHIAQPAGERRHDWEFFADTTAKCSACGLHVPAASAPFHLHNCVPKSESLLPEAKMTCDEDDNPTPKEKGQWLNQR